MVYEPGSPSDKEYAIPLEEARRDAGGERPGRLEALAFGIGLSRRGGGEGAGPRRGRAPRSAGSNRGRGEVTQPGRPRRGQSRDLSERLADAEAAGAPSLWKLGPLLLVLLPALLVGLLLARRDRRQPAT